MGRVNVSEKDHEQYSNGPEPPTLPNSNNEANMKNWIPKEGKNSTSSSDIRHSFTEIVLIVHFDSSQRENDSNVSSNHCVHPKSQQEQVEKEPFLTEEYLLTPLCENMTFTKFV